MIKKNSIVIPVGWMLSCMLMLLVLTGCGSSDDGGPQPQSGRAVLKIYLFAPESPIVTRASTGSVDASAAEKEIHTIDVWVFEHEAPNAKVSYIHLDNLSFDGQKEIAMDITDRFANLPKKPNVDILVVANKESCGLAALNEETTLAELKAASIGTAYFGAASPISSVPDEGLPMSGILENQIITGIPPVYTAMTHHVKLVRAVSKIRFVLSKSASNPPTIADLSISLKANVLPNAEYLFLNGVYPDNKIRIKTTDEYDYEPLATLVPEVATPDINDCENPLSYAYASETGQAYETKINNGIEANDLSSLGTFYLRESDRKLEGTIAYTVVTEAGSTEKSADFIMNAAGDFTRNHTWIVYGYFLGSGALKLSIVDVKGWTKDAENPKVYNW